MWDWIKATAANAVSAGAQYLIDVSFIDGLLNMTYDQAYQTLRQKMFELDDQGYQAFCNALNAMYGQTQQQLNATDQYGSGESWGSSFEDQMAQSLAEIQAGVTHGPSPAFQQLQSRLQNLHAVGQHAQTFRQEAIAAATQSPAVATELPSDDDPPPAAETAVSRVAREVDAFQEHARRIHETFSSTASSSAARTDDGEPLDEMAALHPALFRNRQTRHRGNDQTDVRSGRHKRH